MMAKTKNIKGYFFRPLKQSEMPDELASPDEILGLLDHIGNLSLSERRFEANSEERTILLPHDRLRVAGVDIPDYQGYLSGMLLRKRDISLPMTGIEDGDTLDLKPVDLGGGTLMEVTYFMVHKATGILLFLVNRSAGSYIDLAQNLTSFLGNGSRGGFRMRVGNTFANYLYLASIPNINTLQRVDDLLAVKSLDFRFVGDPTEIRRLIPGDTGTKISEALNIADYFEAFNISIVLKPNRGEKLSKHKIRPFFMKSESILRTNEKSRFSVSGTGSGRSLETIDLLNDRFLFTTTIKYEGEFVPAIEVFNAMQVNFEERLPAMIQAPIE
jgi:hypothetical protein